MLYIINLYHINENDEIEYFDIVPKHECIHYSDNNKLDEKFKKFISTSNEENVENIDINNYEWISNL